MKPPPKYNIGDVVTVKSWWWPDNRLVKCKVEVIWPYEKPYKWADDKPHGYEVRPIDTPGAHGRFIREDTIV